MKKWVSILALVCSVLCLLAVCNEGAWLAQAVVDYENAEQQKNRVLTAENPKYRYFANPVESVLCTYSLTERDIADKIIEKYDFESFVGDARIYDWGAIRMIGFSFEREDFTEGIHRKLKRIAEKEPQIEELLLTMEKPFSRSYVPKIEAYATGARQVKFEVIEGLLNRPNNPGHIIKSKEEYNAYVKSLQGMYPFKTVEKLMDEYDESFFKKNALVVTERITSSSGSHRLTIDGVYVSDGKAYVVVRTDEASMGTAVMASATLAVKVRKSDVARVTKVITLE